MAWLEKYLPCKSVDLKSVSGIHTEVKERTKLIKLLWDINALTTCSMYACSYLNTHNNNKVNKN